MLNCQQTSQLVSQSLDRKLTRRERFAVKLHLLICKYCRRFNQQLKAMRWGLQQLRAKVEEDTSITLSSKAKANIVHLLDESAHQ